MRLTVGPLPAAVYWRRRLVVLTAIVVVALVMFYSCSGSGGAKGGTAGTSPTTAAAAPTATDAVLLPTVEVPAPTTAAPVTSSAYTLPTKASGNDGATEAGQSGSCSDTEMVVTATPARPRAEANTPVDFTIRFRNSGKRSCTRDIGADAQELRIMDGQTVIWSSDDCSPRHGSDVRRFAPDDAVAFTLTWSGKRSRTGTGAKVCTAAATAPAIGVYQLVGRLDGAYSTPAGLRLT